MSDDLVTHLVRFCDALRARGVRIRLSDGADALDALPRVDLADRDEVRRVLRVALKIQPQSVAVFEELFAALWTARDILRAPRTERRSAMPRGRGSASDGMPGAAADADPSAHVDGEEAGFSPEALLRRKDFADYSPADLEAMERLLARLVVRLATRRSRRRVASRSRGVPDLRRSFRRAIARGGEFGDLARRVRAVEETRLLVLCDTSGSMDAHARFALTFLLALRGAVRNAEVFVFNTALVRLTPVLRSPRVGRMERVLEAVARAVPDWSGGTRIGECLATFVAEHLVTRVDGRTIVLILSDGLDRGDVLPVAGAMRAIRARARAVLWLNPLAGDARYEPSARAMAAALPYVDRLLPAHNLESLEKVLPMLSA